MVFFEPNHQFMRDALKNNDGNSFNASRLPSPEGCISAELAEVEDEEQEAKDEEACRQGHLFLLHLNFISLLSSLDA